MGLFDNPLGFLFGDDGDQGAIDRRVNREPEGQRWWERWEQTFGQNGPMDPMNVYPRAMSALETLMQQYFPGWGNQAFNYSAPLGPGAGNTTGTGQGQDRELAGRLAEFGKQGPAMPGLLDLTQSADGVWGANGNSSQGGFDPTGGARSDVVKKFMQSPQVTSSGQAPVYEFSPEDLTASSAGGRQDMAYRIKKPGEAGYDPKRDWVPDEFKNGSIQTSPVGNGYAMAPAAVGGGTASPGLLEPLTLSMGGKSFPVVTKYDQTRNDLAFRYIAALTGMMDPWLQGGLELERGRYGQPYMTQGSDGLIGGALNSIAGGFGKSFGTGLGDWAGGKLFGGNK